jgi:hypothetical protein
MVTKLAQMGWPPSLLIFVLIPPYFAILEGTVALKREQLQLTVEAN